MNPTPMGRLFRTPEGTDLELIRTFRAPIEDVWASITESERTARWFGPWKGKGGAGQKIQYSMVFEEGFEDVYNEMTILACEPPRHLAVTSEDDYGRWHLEAFLTEEAGETQLRFVHHLEEGTDVGSVGPGWEYYLDMLVVSRAGGQKLDFNDYYPSQKEYYAGKEIETREVG